MFSHEDEQVKSRLYTVKRTQVRGFASGYLRRAAIESDSCRHIIRTWLLRVLNDEDFYFYFIVALYLILLPSDVKSKRIYGIG